MSKTPNQWQSTSKVPPPANKPLDLILRFPVAGQHRVRSAKAKHYPNGSVEVLFTIGNSHYTEPLSNVLNWREENY